MKLIVNADDYGYDENSSTAIRQCFARGLISQTTAMLNMPQCKEALEWARQDGFFDRIGLHLNLSEGRPLSDEMRRNRFFCDAEGQFNGRIRNSRLWRFVLPPRARACAEVEIRAQMRAYRAAGLSLSHYDSHGHVCTYPSLLPTVLACAKEFGFKSTRIYINISGNHHGGGMSFPRQLFCAHIARLICRAGLSSSDYLGYAWDLKKLRGACLEPSIVEVLCHPNFRLPDFTRSMSGDLMDWKRGMDESLGLLAGEEKATFAEVR